MIRIAPLDLAGAVGWTRLFEACSSSCFCQYWHFEGSKNDWLARCAHDSDTNLRAQLSRVEVGDARARGLVAWEGDLAVGWMKLVPRAALGKLTRLPVYRSLALDDGPGVYSVGCVLVHPEHRKKGVARALVLAADEHVKAWGGLVIEAYPRHAEAPLHDEETWMGPESVFRHAGYETIAGGGPYPVYRKRLEAAVPA